MKFRKRPVVIDAAQWHGEGWWRITPLAEDDPRTEVCVSRDGLAHNDCLAEPHIHTLEGPLKVSDGDWIIRGVAGEFYPCKPDIFERTYEPADTPEVTR